MNHTPPAPSSGSLLSAMEEIASENELIHCLSWREIQITLRSAAQCIREQQAALDRLLNDTEPHAHCVWAEGSSVTEARATLDKWRIE